MRVVFFGSTQFSVKFLEELKKTEEVVLVVTSPPQRKGRGLKYKPTPVEEYALKNNLEVIYLESLDIYESKKKISSKNPDLFFVSEYGKILSKDLLEIPSIFGVNFHPSLLPRFRGPSPVNWQIIKGEKIAGITFHKIEEKVDAGPIIYQEELPILENEDALSLHNRLVELGVKRLGLVLNKLKNKNFTLTPQDETQATFTPLLTKEMGRINWNKSAQEIFNLIRGLKPWPQTYTYFRKKRLKIVWARLHTSSSLPPDLKNGQIFKVCKDYFVVKCGQGGLEMLKLQPESKRILTAQEFICGYHPQVGETFE